MAEFGNAKDGGVIKAMGAGEEVRSTVNRMIDSGLPGVHVHAMDGAVQALNVPVAEDIKKASDGSDMVFITAGMGEVAGTGAASIIAQLARELGALPVAVIPVASTESVVLPVEKDLGVALVDIGGSKTDLTIYLDGQVCYSGVIPVGGNHVSKDIAVGLRTSIAEAERIKIMHGCALASKPREFETLEVISLKSDKPRHLPTKALTEIIEPRMTELCQLVLEQIKKAGCAHRLPAGLVLAGGGSRLGGLAELASHVTGMPARVGTPVGVTALVDAAGNPVWHKAAGFVLFLGQYHEKHAQGDSDNSLVSIIARKVRGLFAGIGGGRRFKSKR